MKKKQYFSVYIVPTGMLEAKGAGYSLIETIAKELKAVPKEIGATQIIADSIEDVLRKIELVSD